jgi:hypothetical protein
MNATITTLIHSKITWIVTTAIVVIVVALSIPRRKNVPVQDQRALDSLVLSHGTFQASQDTLVLRETTYVRRVDTLVRYVDRLVASSEILHKKADSLAALARVSEDTASRWRSAYDERTREADTLRVALDTAMYALNLERAARLLADTRADNAMTRLGISEGLNTRLAADIKSASECRLLWMRCPSRPVMFAAGVLAGGAVVYVLHKP